MKMTATRRWSYVLALAFFFSLPAFATQYYVSPNGNDNNNSGLSPSSPWQSINKVNNFIFYGGDTVSFQGGATFTGCLLFNSANIQNSSISTAFTVNSYGTGVATIQSNCTGNTSAAVTVDNINGFYLNGLKVVNGFATGASSSTAIGVLLENQGSNTPTQTLVVENSEVTGFAPPSGSKAIGGEIIVLGYAMNGNNGPLNDVEILNNSLHGASVTAGDHCGVCGYGDGENVTNVLMQGNTVYNLGDPSPYGGLNADGMNGATIQYNVIHDIGANATTCGGAAGIESYTSNNVTVRFNEVYNVQPTNSTQAKSFGGTGCDWDGIDLDGGTSNSVVEYNYTHHNAGNGLLAYDSNVGSDVWGNNTYRYNISENDDWTGVQGGLMSAVGSVPHNPLYIYNNTFFDNNTTETTLSSSSACFYFGYGGGTWASGSRIANNICYLNALDRAGRNGQFYYNPYTQSGMTLSNNLYWTDYSVPAWHWGGTIYKGIAAWKATGVETNPVSANPWLSNPGNGGTCNWTPSALTGPQTCPQAYTLQSGSPAISAGVDVASNGGRDYYNNSLASPPSIGAYSTGDPIGGGGGGGTPPAAPTNTSASAISVSTVSVSWNEVLSATSYNVYRGTTSGFTPSVASLIAEGVAASPFTDSGLMHSTTYYYLVEAVNYAGSSGPSNQASATTPDQINYYVSSTGNDSNSGTSPSSPWQTINKVNTSVFPEGAIVNFAAGQTFTGCLVANPTNVPNSSASNPFTFQSYGTGIATIQSNCTGASSSAITGDTVNGFTVDGLKIVNGSQTLNGVLLENQHHASPVQNMVVKNSEITGFAPVSGSPNGGEIWILGYAMNGNKGPLNNIQILNNRLHGATPTSPDGAGVGGYGYGQNISNVLVQGNVVYNLGMPASANGAGILAGGWSSGTIQHNQVHDIGANATSCGGTAGIETYNSSSVTIAYNEVFNVQPSPAYTKGCDWDGIDLDGGTTNSTVQYNYTHHNAGAGYLGYDGNPSGTTWGPNTYRYNISENDDWAATQAGAFGVIPNAPQNPVYIYGNTFFNNLAELGNAVPACFNFGYVAGTWASGSLIADNICDINNPSGGVNLYNNPYGQTGMTLSNNLYNSSSSPVWVWGGTSYNSIASWQAAGTETAAAWGDPLFANAGNGGTCNWIPSSGAAPQPCPQAYQLNTGSPAIGSGVAVTNNGGVDYYQNALTAPPSIGAYSVQASASVTLGNLAQTYTGSGLTATATTSPAGLAVGMLYNGSATAPTAAGSYDVVATVNDPNYAGTANGTLVIAKAVTSLSMASNPATPTEGQAITLTATVTGVGQLTGSVIFTSNAATLCTASLDASGVGSCAFTPTTPNNIAITGQYQADANHLTSSATQTIFVYDTSVTLQLSSTQLTYPGATNATACVASATSASATGAVRIYDGTTLLTTQSLQGGGCAYWYISPGLNAGTHSLTAIYSGDKNNPTGTSLPVTVAVSPVPVTLSASCWNPSFSYGGSYTCSVSLSSNAGSAQGFLSYVVDGGGANSVAISNGGAQFSVATPNAGNHSVTISYAAQGNFANAGPVTESFTVTQAPTQIQLTPSSYDQSASAPFTLTASLSSWSAGAPKEGTVAFYNGTTLLGTFAAGPTVTFNVTGLSAGGQAFSAVYLTGPSGNYASATSATVNVQLN